MAPSNSQLPAHAARARWRANVRRHGHGPELPVALDDGRPKGHALGARPDGVARVLDVGAVDVRGAVDEQRRAHAEAAVGAVRRGLGRGRAGLELGELGGRDAVLLADLCDLGGVGAREDLLGSHVWCLAWVAGRRRRMGVRGWIWLWF